MVSESVLTRYWHFQQDARDREEAEEEEARRQEEEAHNREEEARRQAEEEARRQEEAEQQQEYEDAEPEAVYEEAGEPTMQESEPTDLYEEVTQPQETTQEEVHLARQQSVFSCRLTVFTGISAVLDLAPPSNKRRIWDKKVNKRRPRISAAPTMRRLFEEFCITRKDTINDKGVRFHRWYFRSLIMKLGVILPREFFS